MNLEMPQNQEPNTSSTLSNDAHTALILIAGQTGHLNASLGLANRLRSCGYNIVYLGSQIVEEAATQQNFKFYLAPFLDSVPLPFGIRRRPLLPQKNIYKWLKTLSSQVTQGRLETDGFIKSFPEILEQTHNIVSTLRPSILIFDPFLLLFYLPFYKYKIPAVALSTKPLLDKDPLNPPYIYGTISKNTVLSKVMTQALWAKCHALYVLWEIYERLIANYSVYDLFRKMATLCDFPIRHEWATRPILFDIKLRSLPELVLHAKEFDFPRLMPMKPQTHYVGPYVHMGRVETKFPWNKISVRGKLILCALSTVLHPRSVAPRARFFRNLLSAVRCRPEYTLILVLGPGLLVNMFQDIPDNAYIFESIPQLEVLRHSNLLITHGGSNSVKEAIALGVPLLVYPDRAEQPGIAARIVYHGLGERGVLKSASPLSIVNSIDRVISNPQYQVNVRRMSKIFERYGHSDVAVKLIQTWTSDKASDS